MWKIVFTVHSISCCVSSSLRCLSHLIYENIDIKKPSPLVTEMVPIQLMQVDPNSFDLLEVVQI